MPPKILVTGATGRQGGAVARHLLDAGFPVRILARDPSKPAAAALQRRGAEVARGDMEDPASLDAALVGVQGVYSVQNYWEKGVGYEGEVRQGRNLADAARRAGVSHYVQASVADAERAPDVEHFACKAEIERHLVQLGLPRTILGLVFYMDNAVDPKIGPMLFPVLGGVLKPTTRLHLIAVDDIGAVATAVFRDPGRWIGRTLNVAGDLLTVPEMRAAYQRAAGKKAKGWTLPGFVVRVMSRDGWRQFVWNNDPGWHFPLDETRAVVPKLTSFEEFVRAHGISNL